MNSSRKVRASIRKTLLFLVFASVLGIRSAGIAEVVDRIVAVVNDDIITLSEINHILAPFEDHLRSMGHPPERERTELFNARRQIIDRLIDDKLKDQELKQYDITVTEREIDLAIEDLKQTHGYTDEELREALAVEQMSLEDYRSRIREQILRVRLVNYQVKSKIVITEEDLRAYYDSHVGEYGGRRRYRLRNIIMTPSGSGDERRNAFAMMESIHERLVRGEEFASLARRYSQSPLAASGGALGLFEFQDLSPEIRAAVETLDPGEFTPVLHTEHGFQILLVEDVETLPGGEFEEIRAEIEEKVHQEIVNRRFEAWLTELREQAHIKIIN